MALACGIIIKNMLPETKFKHLYLQLLIIIIILCNITCNNAILVLRTTIEYFNASGSIVCLAALDIKKEFDSVRHLSLFQLLANIGVTIDT